MGYLYMKNVLILENEEIGIKVLSTIVKSVKQECYVIGCRTCNEAYAKAMENMIHLFLVDVRLESETDFNGFKFVQNIRQVEKYKEVPVIFISSLQGYEILAFKNMHCYDFIRKPYQKEEVKNVIERALQLKVMDYVDHRIDFETSGIYYPVEESSIRYIESNRRVIYIHTISDVLELPGKSLKDCYDILDKHKFYQIHKSYIVARKYIKKIEISKRLLYVGGGNETEEIVIGVKYKEGLLEWLNDK